MNDNKALIETLRANYHQQICQDIVRISHNSKKGINYPNFADGDNSISVQVAWDILNQITSNDLRELSPIKGQTAGNYFEQITSEFLEVVFRSLNHVRPGDWIFNKANISTYDQYQHLAYIEELFHQDPNLAAALKGGYIITPDIVIGRMPLPDEEINTPDRKLVRKNYAASLTSLRQVNNSVPILHASISCKWTIRSDRSQNTRTEALNLIRNRKGKTPHIMAVTAEPVPSRLASLALGTGDLDCVYHFALYELDNAIKKAGDQNQSELLQTMVDGKRLKDISDLPFDIAI